MAAGGCCDQRPWGILGCQALSFRYHYCWFGKSPKLHIYFLYTFLYLYYSSQPKHCNIPDMTPLCMNHDPPRCVSVLHTQHSVASPKSPMTQRLKRSAASTVTYGLWKPPENCFISFPQRPASGRAQAGLTLLPGFLCRRSGKIVSLRRFFVSLPRRD